ncbi:TPA_asm: hypothetical protein [Porphyromonas phage phage030a_KCOM2803]|uniref:Uncharacterized protein n=1 Tax=Porphyromonas phage phage030a_KCOM2803 TaxID=3154120 RepID=A0AAT9JEX5_9CAUD
MLDAVGYTPFFVGNRCFLLETGFLSSVQQIQQACFHLLQVFLLMCLIICVLCIFATCFVGLLDCWTRKITSHPIKKNFFKLAYCL